MNLSLFIAKRYFFSKKKKSFINIISWLSMLSISFCTAALIIVLSVFNGFNELIHTLYASFDPELKIEIKKGKSFEVNPSFISKINSIQGVDIVTEIIEDYAYLQYGDAKMVVIFKGVGDNFIDQHRLDGQIVQGNLTLKKEGINYAIIGRGIQHTLSINIKNSVHALQIFYVKTIKPSLLKPSSAYSQNRIVPGGVFSIEKQHDENYIFIPLDFAKKLSNYGNKRTALEIKTSPGEDIETIQENIKKNIGNSFHVLTREEQQKKLYRLLKVEKLFTFLALSFLILIGSINTFFLLMMLALDKKKDLSVLTAMGATRKTIRHIFLLEGGIISFFGAGSGLMLGGALCFLQQNIGLVGLGVENAVVTHYPIKMIWSDLATTSGVVIAITLLIAFYPALLASKSYSTKYL